MCSFSMDSLLEFKVDHILAEQVLPIHGLG